MGRVGSYAGERYSSVIVGVAFTLNIYPVHHDYPFSRHGPMGDGATCRLAPHTIIIIITSMKDTSSFNTIFQNRREAKDPTDFRLSCGYYCKTSAFYFLFRNVSRYWREYKNQWCRTCRTPNSQSPIAGGSTKHVSILRNSFVVSNMLHTTVRIDYQYVYCKRYDSILALHIT